MGAFLLLSALLFCMNGFRTCAGETSTAQHELFANRVDKAFDPATIDAIGDTVFDWQIAHLPEPDETTTSASADRRQWVFGAMYVGMMTWAKLPGHEKYFEPLKTISEENDWRLGDRLFHADDHIVGQLYLTFYEMEHDERMIDPMIHQFDQILEANPDVSLEFVRGCQDRWCWADALFMAPPTFVELSLATGQEKYLDYADKEFWATTDFLMDPDYSLFYRDSRFFSRQDDEGNKIFWSRGNGWVYAGVVNILRVLPNDHSSFPKYVQLYKDMSKMLADLQHDNGFWRVSLLAKEAYSSPETSGTGFIVYGLAWGVNNGHLNAETYGPVVKLGWSALVSAVGDEGKLGWVQRIGAAPDSVSETDSGLYGVGAFLLASEQMLQMTEISTNNV